MIRNLFYMAAAMAAITMTGCSGNTASTPSADTTDDYYVAAFVWPSCHDDSLGHKYLWGDGEGEWEVIKKGDPRFEGHQQPKQPLWGYEHDNDPKVVERWIDTALKYGVNTFIYDWYWFMNGPYLEGAVNDGFLKAANNEKMNFYLMWANHFVKHNYWNYHRYGDDESILFDPVIDENNYKIIVDRIISQYFTRPNYVKIDGCPVFGIFSIDNFIAGFDGDLDKAGEAIKYFDEKAREAGFKGVHLQEIHGGGWKLNEETAAKMKQKIEKVGIDSEAFYNMGGFDCDYMVHGKNGIEIREQWDSIFDVPVYPTVSIGWDDTPRFPAKGAADVTRFHNTPTTFATYLKAAKDYADSHPDQPKFIMINAWNEWVEGSYLLPDRLNGYGYLEAVRDVLNGEYD
ncbi:MAG: glycoside hydrolase family 99-like domain-containing protein [Muribaculaceae bacterium]|nr:glycoside hydrolase family 99-like domain-containing protein [Muribaculaceae bacterium]